MDKIANDSGTRVAATAHQVDSIRKKVVEGTHKRKSK